MTDRSGPLVVVNRYCRSVHRRHHCKHLVTRNAGESFTCELNDLHIRSVNMVGTNDSVRTPAWCPLLPKSEGEANDAALGETGK